MCSLINGGGASMLKSLTQTDINKAKTKTKEYHLRDGSTQLYYRVKPNGHRSWIVKYQDPVTGKRRKYTLEVPTNLLEDAQTAYNEFFYQLNKGNNPANPKPVLKILTLNEAIDLYESFAQSLRAGENRMQDLRQIARWQNSKNEILGDKEIDKIQRDDLIAWQKDELLKSKKRTVNKKTGELYTTIKRLHKEQKLSKDIELPPRPDFIKEDDRDDNRRYFQPDERKRLIAAAKKLTDSGNVPQYIYTAVMLSLYTGIRPNTLFNLEWRDWDPQAKTLTLRPQIMKTKDKWIIPLNKTATSALSDWKTKQEKQLGKGNVPSTIIGQKVSLNSLKKQFNRILVEAQISGVTWYNMRHDFASQLVMQGVSLYTVMHLMCHKNIKTTQIYAHLSPDLKRAGVMKLDAL